MKSRNGWLRVNSDRLCPVCEKPDWCLVQEDASAAICARIKEGAVKHLPESGWLHRLCEREKWQRTGFRRFKVRRHDSTLSSNLGALAESCQRVVVRASLDEFSHHLGLSSEGLFRLGIGWETSRQAWSFPMFDAGGRVIGIRLRAITGAKFAVPGGHNGLFVPTGLDASALILIAEGPTDTCALLDLGFEAIGRPSNTGGVDLIIEFVRHRRPREVVIMADRDPDQAGQKGAETLAAQLVAYCRDVRVIVPPDGIKDARDWKAAGATHEMIQAAIKLAPIRRLAFHHRARGHSRRPEGGGACPTNPL